MTDELAALKATVTTGADLVKALQKSGTPDHLLTTAGELLAQNPRASKADVLAALQAHPNVQLGTIRKALVLCDASVPDPADPTAYPVRAPEGGVTVAGAAYPAGAVVPPDVLAKATPDEDLALRRSGPAAPAAAPAKADPDKPAKK